MTNVPEHIAIIMDGNGRWAKEQNLKRTSGHSKGAEVARKITRHCAHIGVKYLTLYAFSTENWQRPKLEVEFIMKLIDTYLKRELPVYLEEGIKLRTIGDTSRFSKSLQKTIRETEEKTKNGKRSTQVLALNYGSRDEIVRAVKKLNDQNLEVTEENIEANLDTSGIPDVDIMIRTSGEVRLSNYLLWQNAYAEMFFTPTYWPDFNKSELDDIISDFNSRERRFGGI